MTGRVGSLDETEPLDVRSTNPPVRKTIDAQTNARQMNTSTARHANADGLSEPCPIRCTRASRRTSLGMGSNVSAPMALAAICYLLITTLLRRCEPRLRNIGWRRSRRAVSARISTS